MITLIYGVLYLECLVEARKTRRMSVFHDEVEIEDFEYDEETETYYYPCPCGDQFEITKVMDVVRMYLGMYIKENSWHV